MSVGRPIITTNAPGCKETVEENKNGYLVPVKNVEALIAAMLKFVENTDLIKKMGSISRLIAEKKYDVHKVNRNILSVIWG